MQTRVRTPTSPVWCVASGLLRPASALAPALSLALPLLSYSYAKKQGKQEGGARVSEPGRCFQHVYAQKTGASLGPCYPNITRHPPYTSGLLYPHTAQIKNVVADLNTSYKIEGTNPPSQSN